MGPIETLRAEAAVIVAAPWSYAICVGVALGALWLIFNWRYGGIIAGLKERIEARDDRIKVLERDGAGGTLAVELAALKRQFEPRRLTEEQRFKLRNALVGNSGTVGVMYNSSGPDCQRYAQDFREVFEEAGWKARCDAVLSASANSRSGLSLAAENLSELAPAQDWVAKALAAAGLHFDMAHMETPGHINVRLIVAVKSV